MADGINVPIPKAKDVLVVTNALIEALPQEVYNEILLQGFKAVLNRGMSKITLADLGDADKVKSEAMLKAQANLEDVQAGKVRITGGAKAGKVSGAVKTEAMRLSRNIIKDELKRLGHKISHYEASEITTFAKEYLEENPSILETAKANLEARAKIAAGEGDKLSSLVAKIKTSDVLVAKAEAKKKKGGTISAKQAGMPAKAKKAKADLHA